MSKMTFDEWWQACLAYQKKHLGDNEILADQEDYRHYYDSGMDPQDTVEEEISYTDWELN